MQMTKEVDLKKIELNVSVNCCEGCQRKVKKLLQSVEGVLSTEIDLLQPKVTVVGKVDPQILIKKLWKAGKQSQLWSSSGNYKKDDQKDHKSSGVETPQVMMAGKEKSKEGDSSSGKKAGCSTTDQPCRTCTHTSYKQTVNGTGGDHDQGKGKTTTATTNNNKGSVAPNKDKESTHDGAAATSAYSSSSGNYNPEEVVVKNVNKPHHDHECEVKCAVHPSMVHNMGNNFTTYTGRYCYMVEPSYVEPLPYYTTGGYAAAPPPPPPYYVYNYATAVPQPQAPRVGDYFNDENTVGCYVM